MTSSTEELREIAKALNILSVNKFKRDQLIRVIQLAKGRDECFGEDSSCADRDCVWYSECRGKESAESAA